jgi:methyltransferase OMS1
LEVACGTGRNFSYYDPKKVRTLLAMDACDGMVEEARAKLRTRDGGTTVREAIVTRGDTHRMRNVKTGSVDTVVDTFGLCSYEDAVGALREMKRVVKRDGGRVLLLEHGRSEYGWLSNILDHFADAHARRWGCYWNRDILKLIEDAGLEIVEKSTHHLGTTFVIEATPRKG